VRLGRNDPRTFLFCAVVLLLVGVAGWMAGKARWNGATSEIRGMRGKSMVTESFTETEGRRANRLIHEKSPYLLQHAYNPVDWYPWGEEAFAKAKREDKPIFLSVGYSTCYWCHVMEKESFEDSSVAAVINDGFVPIKVDREERPDIDAIYMSAVQAMTGQGGWPMSVFLTPDGKPFWGGTYFPPHDRAGHPGLTTILHSLEQAWKTRREDVLRSSEQLTEAIARQAQAGHGAELTQAVLDTAAAQMARVYDRTYGGFGPAPKFPRSHSLSLLLCIWHRTRDDSQRAMVEQTLDAMARGGMYDQLGGGFHRYSTDARWLVPHFEKMLYDQALLARTYLEAYQATRKDQYAAVARDIFAYVLRDLRDAGGAFYSAEDAGEVGREGEFYVWTPREIAEVLEPKDAALVLRYYGVTQQGNFEHGTSILHAERPLEDVAREESLSPEEAAHRLARARSALLAARGRRTRPHRDDKILTDWNGLMIGALAYGGRVLDEPRYTRAASEAATFVLDHLRSNGRLLHRYRDGESKVPAFLDDYAFLTHGLLDLYEATFDPQWLKEARDLTEETTRLFWDEASGGFFMSGEHNERLISRTKELYDGAVPSGNSIAALNLLRVGVLTLDAHLRELADRQIATFGAQVAEMPYAYPQFLIAVDFWLGPAQEIVIAGSPAHPATHAMLRTVNRRYLPRALLVLKPEGPDAQAIESMIPFIKDQNPVEGKSTAYVCQNYACALPTTDPAHLNALLDASR
jgi:uncharacterized protein YyaL (SSP411 family)